MRTPVLSLALVASVASIAAAQPAPQPLPPHPTAPPPAPYPYPYPYPPPPPPPVPPAPPTGDLEVIVDFAALGVLGGITLIDARDLGDQGTGTLLVMSGAIAGGATGWILADRMQPTRADGHATTMGMSLGLLNGALLLVPLHLDDSSEEVLPTLLVGGTAGALGGLALGRALDLTSGQTMFATNLAVLGLGTSALASALINRDDDLDRGEMTALVVGLDAGAIAGLALAPKVDWSYRRARFVGVATLAGTFLGTMLGTALATDKASDGRTNTDEDLAVIGVLVGMWGGFVGGIGLTSDWTPDPRFARPATPAVTATPLVGSGRYGLALSGQF